MMFLEKRNILNQMHINTIVSSMVKSMVKSMVTKCALIPYLFPSVISNI